MVREKIFRRLAWGQATYAIASPPAKRQNQLTNMYWGRKKNMSANTVPNPAAKAYLLQLNRCNPIQPAMVSKTKLKMRLIAINKSKYTTIIGPCSTIPVPKGEKCQKK